MDNFIDEMIALFLGIGVICVVLLIGGVVEKMIRKGDDL